MSALLERLDSVGAVAPGATVPGPALHHWTEVPVRRPAPRVVPAPGAEPAPLACAGALEVRLARGDGDIEAAQRLRWQVFAGELGAALPSQGGLDHDIFDPHCEHLVAVDRASDQVVGTYRLLMPAAARRLGGLYTDSEFDLTRLEALRPRMVELGRSCVHPDYRSGGVMMLLWSGLGALLADFELRYLIGCVSVSMEDGGQRAASLYRQLEGSRLVDESRRVWPRERLAVERFGNGPEVAPPPLFKGYLRAGAVLLGEPHVDTLFDCADFPMMLDLDGLKLRYQRRFRSSGS